jgi:hypothetical protein
MSLSVRDNISEVRLAALDLHKLLVAAVQRDYERGHGRVGSSGQLLNLVAYDPAFAWLHPLSELIVALDELLAAPEHAVVDAAAVRVELEQLLEHSGAGFRDPYLDALQIDPDVVLAHAEVQRAVAALPAVRPEEVESLRKARPSWSARAQRRLR